MGSNASGISTARQYPTAQIHYLRKAVALADFTNATNSAVKMPGGLPAGAEIVFAKVRIVTAFNAATTNVLTCGTNSSDYNNISNSTDIDESTTEATIVWRGADLTITNPIAVYVKYTQSGDAATAGDATIIVAYVANNDQ